MASKKKAKPDKATEAKKRIARVVVCARRWAKLQASINAQFMSSESYHLLRAVAKLEELE